MLVANVELSSTLEGTEKILALAAGYMKEHISAGVPGQAEQPARQWGAAPRCRRRSALYRACSEPIERFSGRCAHCWFSQLPALFFPPSYTHRHYCGVARAPGGSCAGGRFPPRPFVWGIPKIDRDHTNFPQPARAGPRRHPGVAVSTLDLPGMRRHALGGSGAHKPPANLATYPILNLPTYPIHLYRPTLYTSTNLPYIKFADLPYIKFINLPYTSLLTYLIHFYRLTLY